MTPDHLRPCHGIYAGLPTYSGDWKESPLGDLVDTNPEALGNGTPGDFGFRYIDLSSVKQGVTNWDSVKETTFRAAPSRARRCVRQHDVLFGTVRPSLQSHTIIGFVPGSPLVASTGFAVLRAGTKSYPGYINHLIFSELVAAQVRRLETGSNYPAVNESDLRKVLVPNPDQDEQARIAEVLDTLDEAILKTEDILLKRQLAKQGLLHDLLSVGLGANGEIRDIQKVEEFKATEVGMIPSTWTVKSLDQIATNHDGKRIPLKQADRVKRQGPYPYYGASGVIDSIDDYLFDGTYVLLGEDGENVVSRNLPLAFVVTGKFWPNNHAHVYEPQPGIKAGFLVELLEACDFSGMVSGSAQPKLTQDALRRLRFAVPPPLEQELILKLIEAANEAIRAENQQLLKLNKMKSGLSADLLTGQVRTIRC